MGEPTAKAKSSIRRSGVQSIDVGSRLLEVLSAQLGPMHLRDIAAASNMSASKAHRYLISLMRAGLAEQDPVSGRYYLGPMCLRIGLAALHRRKAVQYATRAAIELNQAEDITVALVIWGEHGPTIVGWYDSSQVLICNLGVGAVLPLLRSSAGRVFLAYLPRATTYSMVERELNTINTYLPSESIRTKIDVDGLIQQVRQARLGMTDEVLLPGLGAFSAPIFDHQGGIVASISIIGVAGMTRSPSFTTLVEKLRQATEDISIKLGFASNPPGMSLTEQLENRSK